MEELERRLKGRGTETDEEIANRMQRISYELSQQDKYDYVIINDDLETAITALSNVIDEDESK